MVAPLLIAAIAGKIACAPFVDVAPKVDGVLDDAAWSKAEVRTDFEDALGAPLSRADYPAEVRFVQDGKRLYVALKVTFKDLPAFTYQPWKGVFRNMEKKEFSFDYLAEIFVDPGRTMTDCYQYLVRVDNTCAAHFKMDWTKAKNDIEIASKTEGTTWTLEYSFPAPGKLETGMSWGFHLSYRDFGEIGQLYAFSGASNQPQLFMPLLIGTYAEWFADAFAKQQARIDAFRKEFPRGETARQLDLVQAALDSNRQQLVSHPSLRHAHMLYLAHRRASDELDRINDQLNLKRAGVEMRTLIKDVDFNEWAWAPIEYGMAKELLAIKARGDEMPYDLRGPMLRKPVGRKGLRNDIPFPHGKASTDAVKGTSLHYIPQKVHAVFFQHGPFYGVFKPDRRYRYEFWVKGNGPYCAAAELLHLASNGAGQEKYFTVPIDRRNLPAEWTKVAGVFEFPKPPEGRVWQTHNGFTFSIPPGTEIWIDEIKIWELD